jgi:glycosyltransferase involved in cell wall biosynthesis/peptidoglycan/xylan/chitin deacetylase (PgdA/CDA1 family)
MVPRESRPATPTISATVITRNRAELLARTLPTVLEQQLPGGSFEVIVVDDGSSDATPQVLEQLSARHELHLVRQPPRGVGAARNAAMEAAGGEIVLFLDDDLLCEPGLLTAHLTAHMRQRDPLIVVGRLGVAAESPSGLVAAWLATVAAEAHTRRSRMVTLRDAFVAANCSASLELLRSAGGFDEAQATAREEHELGLRLVRAGACPFYEPRALALEIVRKPLDTLLRDARAVGYDEVGLCRRYGEYRRHSPLARLSEGPWWKRHLRRLTTQWRLAEGVVFSAPARLARTFGMSAASSAAAALVGARYGVALRRGAMTATGSWDELVKEFGQRLPVLCFHRVGPRVAGANPEVTVTPRRFKAQLRLLRARRYTPIAAAQWVAWCSSAEPLPRRPVLLTFDDAYSDLGTYAFPALAGRGSAATLFVPSGYLGGENSWDEALQAGSHYATHSLLHAADLLVWNERGVEIGAHSRTHARLPDLSPAALTAELEGSKRDLEELIGARVSTFAYPFGAVDERVRDAAASTFEAAFTIEEGLNTLATDPFLLRRSMVRSTDTPLDVLLRLRLGWSPLHRLRLRLARSRIR